MTYVSGKMRSIDMNERDYRYAKVEEQVRKINKFLCISTAILNVITLSLTSYPSTPYYGTFDIWI